MPSGEESLEEYRRKRDFARTSEPQGGKRGGPGEGLIFVIQKHAARRLHYDFRLEVEGVLKSWAVPKGPSTDPQVKRLAMAVEDHPIEYAEFEGAIPAGEYGAGAVIVWDTGCYRNTTERRGKPLPPSEALERGHFTFELYGRKLRGRYALTRTGIPGDERWLLVKMRDQYADEDDITETRPESVVTGRTLEQVAQAAQQSG